MKSDYEFLKENYGESFARECRAFFPTILEYHGVLSKIMSETFAENHFLLEDIVKNNKTEEFKNFIFAKFYDVLESKQIDNIQERLIERPEVLMDKAGYVLMHCKTSEDVQKFKRFYAPGEELCTFRDDDRIDNWHIFFAVKKNVSDIKRGNFDHPMRQDEYGTSVISLQFSRGEKSILSIKNRYNHTVADPDSTFSNDLENIIAGLTESFEKYYGIKIIKGSKHFELPSYVLAGDGKYYPYNIELDNIYYCPNNIVIENTIPRKLDKSTYEMFDYHIFNKVTKKFETKVKDSFTDGLDYITKIETEYNPESKLRTLLITYNDIDALEVRHFCVVTNERGQMVEAFVENAPTTKNPYLVRSNYLKVIDASNITELPSNSIRYARSLFHIGMDNLETINANSFEYLYSLYALELPNVKKISHNCFEFASNLKSVSVPNAEELGINAFKCSQNLKTLNAPNIISMASGCFEENSIETLYLPKIERMNAQCFRNSKHLDSLYAPNLTTLGNLCFQYVPYLNELNIQNIQKIPGYCFQDIGKLKRLYLPCCVELGDQCFMSADALSEFCAPVLHSTGKGALYTTENLVVINLPVCHILGIESFRNTKAKVIDAPWLVIAGGHNFVKAENLETFNAPSLQTLGNNCLKDAVKLTQLEFSDLESAGNSCFSNMQNLKIFSAPNLIELGNNSLSNAQNLETFKADSLNTLRQCVLKNAVKLKKLITPSLYYIYCDALKSSDGIDLAVVGEDCNKHPALKSAKCVQTEDGEDLTQKYNIENPNERV